MLNKEMKIFQTCWTSPWRGLWSVAIAGPPEHGFVNVSQNLYNKICRIIIVSKICIAGFTEHQYIEDSYDLVKWPYLQGL